MNSLFFKLTSVHPFLRKMRNDSSSSSTFNNGKPIWIQIQDRVVQIQDSVGSEVEVKERERLWELLLEVHNQQLLRNSLYNIPSSITRYYFNTHVGCYTIQYIFGVWKPITAYREEVDFRIGSRKLSHISAESACRGLFGLYSCIELSLSTRFYSSIGLTLLIVSRSFCFIKILFIFEVLLL